METVHAGPASCPTTFRNVKGTVSGDFWPLLFQLSLTIVSCFKVKKDKRPKVHIFATILLFLFKTKQKTFSFVIIDVYYSTPFLFTSVINVNVGYILKRNDAQLWVIRISIEVNF